MDYLSKVMTAAIWGEHPPAAPVWNQWVHKSRGITHCETCLSLHGRWFLREKTPQWPHHAYCHCELENVPYSDVLKQCRAVCAYAKIDPYFFNPEKAYSHGKERLLAEWGYVITDAAWMQQEFERQALEKYINGDYTLGRLNEKGQRISIRVEIPRKDQAGTVSFITGWMVHPNGEIRLTTPYGGK